MQFQGTEVTGLAAKVFVNFCQRGKAKTCLKPRQLTDFDFVHVVVAAHQQQPNLAFNDFTFIVGVICRQHQRLDRGGQGHAQQLGHVFASAFAGCRHFGQGLRGLHTQDLASRIHCLGFFHVGRVIAVRAIHDGVFAGGGNHLELFAQVAANGAAVSRHRAVAQAKAVKNTPVGFRHIFITLNCRHHIAVKAVRVFHDELASAHQTEAWTALVAELGLYLVEIFRQLFVAAQLLARNVGHHFFAGGLHHVVAVVPVFDAQ